MGLLEDLDMEMPPLGSVGIGEQGTTLESEARASRH